MTGDPTPTSRCRGVVPFPSCPKCKRPVSGLMRSTAGHYWLLHHSTKWRCSVTPTEYADIADVLADYHAKGAKAARAVATQASSIRELAATLTAEEWRHVEDPTTYKHTEGAPWPRYLEVRFDLLAIRDEQPADGAAT